MTDIFPDQFGNLHGGFDLGMPLTLDITVDAGTEQIRAVKRVLYWAQRIDAAQMPNQTPTIDTVSGFYDRDEATFDPIDEPMPIPHGRRCRSTFRSRPASDRSGSCRRPGPPSRSRPR